MNHKAPHPNANAILAALPINERQRFQRAATPVQLKSGAQLSEAGRSIPDVYFPTSAVLAVLSVTGDDVAVQSALVGCEGMAPLAPFHQVDTVSERLIVQVPGEALRMSTEALHDSLS